MTLLGLGPELAMGGIRRSCSTLVLATDTGGSETRRVPYTVGLLGTFFEGGGNQMKWTFHKPNEVDIPQK